MIYLLYNSKQEIMKEQIFISIPVESFKDLIKASIKEVLNSMPNSEALDSKDDFLSRQETAKLLYLSLTTLDTYTREGILKGYKVGHRVLYKKSEINNSLLEKITSVKFRNKH